MKILIFSLFFFANSNVFGQNTNALVTDLNRVRDIYIQIDSLKSISAQNKLYIDSLDGVFFPKVVINCPDFVGQKTIIDKTELRQWAVQYQSQFTQYKAILEEFVAVITLIK